MFNHKKYLVKDSTFDEDLGTGRFVEFKFPNGLTAKVIRAIGINVGASFGYWELRTYVGKLPFDIPKYGLSKVGKLDFDQVDFLLDQVQKIDKKDINKVTV